MIISVVNEHHWTPDVIDALFINDRGYNSLGYWYDVIKAEVERRKNKK
jgi:hypothetical protein